MASNLPWGMPEDARAGADDPAGESVIELLRQTRDRLGSGEADLAGAFTGGLPGEKISDPQTNRAARGVVIVADVAAVPGGGATLDLALEWAVPGTVDPEDPESGTWLPLLTVAGISAVGTVCFGCYPTAAAALFGDGDHQATAPLPATWRVRATPSNGTEGGWTYHLTGSTLL